MAWLRRQRRSRRRSPRQHDRAERDHKKKVARREPHSPEGKGGHGRGKSYPAFATRVRIGMGRLMKLRPSDIVGAIANEAGVSSKDIGAISIGDKYSIVEVHKRDVDAIVAALGKTKLRGKRAIVREERG